MDDTRAKTTDQLSAHRRLPALDGLRGAAAAVVVFSHAVLTSTIGDAYTDELSDRDSGSFIAHLLANTPVHYLVMATEAVIIFFVLSGMVLVLPMLRGKGLDLWAYYPRRFVRLWVPAAAAMIFAIGVILATDQNPDQAPSEWSRQFSFPTLGANDIVSSFLLITGSPKLNNPLWSLKWELLFSLLLPLAFLITLRLQRFLWVALITCGVITGVGTASGSLTLKFMPMFLAGCIVAKIITDRGGPKQGMQTWAWMLGGLLLLGLPNIARILMPVNLDYPFSSLIQGTTTIGAALIVYALVGPSLVASLFSTRPFQFLGRISFSVYLVHAPVLLGVLHLMPGTPNKALLISIPLSFVLGWLFAKFVEEPSAKLARSVGERSARARARIAA